jgi:hypothetical protein
MELNDKQFELLISEVKNTVDDRFKSFVDGVKSGEKHEQPASATVEFISETKNSINLINDDIAEIKEILKTVPTQDKMTLMIKNAIEASLCKCDTKYAGKTTENIVNGAIVIILTAFMGSIVYLVIR